jgi:DNA-binding beta-propeller fold protein YncE
MNAAVIYFVNTHMKLLNLKGLTAIVWVVLLAGYQTVPAGLVLPGESSMADRQAQARVRAPELTGGRGWLNTSAPLLLAGLRGKVVLLDFWTYGCINCIHIIPDLKRLEAKYPNQLVVIGVHSAKFENEKQTENIRRIILRYGIEHPVLNDADFKVWQAYAISAWPTQVLIDPAGYVIGTVSGEGNYDLLDKTIASTIDDFRKRGELKESPLQLALERAQVGDLPLSFPGKILADAAHDRLFIADSNHNRIVVANLAGKVTDVIGAGAPSAIDGAYDRATFNRPQGLALRGDQLYVADTENHLIRRIDLKRRVVETVAGDGRQSRTYEVDGPGREVSLNSPWDLTIMGDTLYIAMAGQHQIWQLNLTDNRVSTFAGSGREARGDGSLDDSAFAQPSGITNDGKFLYVADSESNIIRRIDPAKGEVETLVGGDLFDFGDVDGTGDDVRLQHPLGLAAAPGKILIADTYNHRIKELDPVAGKVTRLVGAGRPGQADGADASFYEPGGLSFDQGKLYIADTNNNAIRVYDLQRRITTTLPLAGLMPPLAAPVETAALPNSDEITAPEQTVAPNSSVGLTIQVDLPAGYHLNPMAPQRYVATVESGGEFVTLPDARDGKLSHASPDLRLPVRIKLATKKPGRAELKLQLSLFYCREDNTGTCRINTLVWRMPVTVTPGATVSELTLKGSVPGS